MRVIAGLVPPSGWHFRQKLVSSPQRPQYQIVNGASYDQLLDNVFKFRLNNLEMIKSGTATKEQVAVDVTRYVCGHWPTNCTGSRAELAAAAAGNFQSLPRKSGYRRPLTRIEDWLSLLNERPLRWVDQARAMERAKICLECPMNQTWRTGCVPCNNNAERRAMLIRGSHTTGLEPKLKACTAYGTLLELSIWLEDDFSQARREPVPQCWKLAQAKV